MNGENLDCEVSGQMEHLKRVMSTRNQSAGNVEFALPVPAMLGPMQVVVLVVVGDLVDCPLAAHPFLRCTESVDCDRSNSTMRRW